MTPTTEEVVLFTPIPSCIECGVSLLGSYVNRKYCSGKCKARYRRKHPNGKLSDGHKCRICGAHITLLKGQANKWLCSVACVKASVAKGV